MKVNLKRVIFAILTIITFTIIFIFSEQNGELSGKTSRGFTEKIINLLPVSKNWDKDKKQDIIENLQTVVRKLAHFTIYTIAGIWIMAFVNTYDNLAMKNKILLALIVGVIYAILDEFHQMFSGGRTPSVKDVGIDSLGVCFGISIDMLIFRIIKYKNINSRQNEIQIDCENKY